MSAEYPIVETHIGPRGTGALIHPFMLPSAEAVTSVAQATLPASVSYRQWNGPVKDQGSTPECVAFGAAALMETLTNMLFGTSPILSPEWLYDQCKQRDGIPNEGGTYTTVAGQVLAQIGDVRERDDPFDPAHAGQPPAPGIRQTPEYRIDSFEVWTGTDSILDALRAYGPIMLTLQCSKEFFWPQQGGIVDVIPGETGSGAYHGPLLVAWDDASQRGTIMNSWSKSYGDGGYCYPSRAWLDTWCYSGVSVVPDYNLKLAGDLDGSSDYTVADFQICMMAAIRSRTLNPEAARIADVDGDGRVTVRDALRILGKMVGL